MWLFSLLNVTKIYSIDKKENTVLKNISLNLPTVGLVSIIGKSGSGKSTLLNIIYGIEKPSKGVIKFLDKNISHLSDKSFSNYHLNDISMVFQHYNLISGVTSLDNILIPLLMKGTKRKKAIEIAKDYFKRFSMEDLMYRKIDNLSGGEKQRIAIIRSLINSPKAILCDEPTGALDSKNALLIMNTLKEISKNLLVVMVSHSKNLVEQFSDRVIKLKDGEIISDEEYIKNKDKVVFQEKKKSYSSKWTSLFEILNIKRNIKKNILSVVTCSVGFVAIFLSIGFYNGSKSSQKLALENNLSLTYATASEVTYHKINNSPLTYEKNVRPSLETLDNKLDKFSYLMCKPNLGYLFSNIPNCSFENKDISGFTMVPLLDMSLDTFGKNLLIYGTSGDNEINNVIVNEEFCKLVHLSNKEIINKELKISSSTSLSFDIGDENTHFINDEFSYVLSLVIVGVVKEFSFLNTPKIYYSYNGAQNYLKRYYPENYCLYIGDNINYYDLIDRAEENNEITNYSSVIFLTDINEKDDYFDFIKELNDKNDNFKISSDAYNIQESYSTFIDSFSSAILVFSIISFIGINFIIGMISFSIFIENKKESAILTCLGAKISSLKSIYLTNNYIITFVSIIIGVLFSFVFESFLNNIIYLKFSLPSLINIPFTSFVGIPFGVVLLIASIAVIVSTLFTIVPLTTYRHFSLVDELRDE